MQSRVRVRNVTPKYPKRRSSNAEVEKAVEVKENRSNGLRRCIPAGSSERHHAAIEKTVNDDDNDIAKHKRRNRSSISTKREGSKGINADMREEGVMVAIKRKDSVDTAKQSLKQEECSQCNNVERTKEIIAEMKKKSKDSADNMLNPKSKLGVGRMSRLGGTNMTQQHQNKRSINKRPRAPKVDKIKQMSKQEGSKGINADMREEGVMVAIKRKDSVDMAKLSLKQEECSQCNNVKRTKEIIAEMKKKTKDSADNMLNPKSKLGVDRMSRLGGTNMTQQHQNKRSINQRPRAPKPLPSCSLFHYKPRAWLGGKQEKGDEVKEDQTNARHRSRSTKDQNKSGLRRSSTVGTSRSSLCNQQRTEQSHIVPSRVTFA